MRRLLLLGVAILLSCQEPTRIELDNDNDPNSSSYIPDAPSAVVAEIANASIIIEWDDNSEAETGFRVERSIDGADFMSIGTVQSNVTVYEDEPDSLAFNTVVYRVLAYAEAGNSEPAVSNPLNGRYLVTVTINGGGIVNNSEAVFSTTVAFDSTLQLVATPLSGWKFTHWLLNSEEIVANPLDVRVSGKLDYQVVFSRLYDFEAQVVGNGRISETLILSKNSYSDGSLVTLEAIPDSGWTFVNWTGDVTGETNPTDIRIDQSKSVTANFSPIEYSLSLTPVGGGRIENTLISGSSLNEGYTYNSVLELLPVADTGWIFREWRGDVSGTQIQQVVQMNSNKSIQAVFTQKFNDLEVIVDGVGNVLQEIIQTKTSTYVHGTLIKLTADPGRGWRFLEWMGDITGNENPTQILVDGDKRVTAKFEPTFFTLNDTFTGQGSVNVRLANGAEESGTYQAGSELTLEAIPADSSWYFDRWEGDFTGTNNPATIIINDHSSITAVFRNEVTDIDGNVYSVVRIGNQTWMAENLRVTKFSDGTALTYATNVSPWVASANAYTDPGLNSELVIDLGYMYRGTIAQSTSPDICPDGWIVPTLVDYQALSSEASRLSLSLREKSSTYWTNAPNNSSGFRARGAGYIHADGSNIFRYEGFQTTSDFVTRTSSVYSIQWNDSRGGITYSSLRGYSIRCLKAN